MVAIILSSLILGAVLGVFNCVPSGLLDYVDPVSRYLLMALLFLVGLDVGSNRKALAEFKKMGVEIFWVPGAIIAGSLVGGWTLSLFIDLSAYESLAIASGMGYYTLSGIIITNKVGSSLGTMAFLSNILREILTIIITPFIAPKNHLSPIAAGGATSMDTTLPVIIKFTSKTAGFVSIISGVIITLLVPLLVAFFARLI